jgi:hypothetical protein
MAGAGCQGTPEGLDARSGEHVLGARDAETVTRPTGSTERRGVLYEGVLPAGLPIPRRTTV